MNGQIKHAVSKVTYTKVANGRYRVVNALGQVNILSAEDFLTLYSPVANVIKPEESWNADIGKWAEDTAGPFEKSTWPSSAPLSKEDIALINDQMVILQKEYKALQYDVTGEIKEAPVKPHLETRNEERKHLSPDTIANLIQSNLEHNPDGLSRTMLGRTGKREPRQ